jgi:exosortase
MEGHQFRCKPQFRERLWPVSTPISSKRATVDRVPAGDAFTGTQSQSSGRWLLWLIVAELTFLYAPTVVWLWHRWTLSVWQHAHGLLIVPMVAYLVWRELGDHKQLAVSANAWGFFILAPALMLHMLDAGMHTELLSAVSLFIALPGLALLFLGSERTKSILFPLVFLFFTLPIPLVVTEPLHMMLREIATAASAYVIPKFGIPVFVEGTTLHIPRGSLQVADACSGFSTLYASLAIACLVAYMCRDWRRRVLVLLVAAPVAIAANIIRVVLLALTVDWFGIDVLDTAWHQISGMLTFAIALPVIFWLGMEPAVKEARQ